MKNIFYLAFFLISTVLKAQNFLVGDTTCNYVVLNRNINLSDPPNTPYSYSVSYGIDVDGDAANDLVFDWYRNGSHMGSSSYRAGVMRCNSPTNYEVIYSSLSCSASTLVTTDLSYGSSLNSALTWSLNPVNNYVYSYNLPYWFSGSSCGNFFQYGVTNVYLGFRKVLANDTIYGWIFLRTNTAGYGSNDQIVSYSYKHTASNSTVIPVFTNSVAPIICQGSLINLSASPSGGSFYGLGVSGSTLNTAVCGGGVHTVYYNIGCGTAALAVTVDPPPIAFTNSLMSVCNGDSLLLTASPSGGIFSGAGVSGNMFHSSVPGLGNTIITYSYTDANSCSATKTVNISVLSSPNLTVTPTSTIMLCPGDSRTLSVSGASGYTWSTGSNNSSIIVNPTTTTTTTTIYSVSGVFATGSCPASTKNYTLSVVTLLSMRMDIL